MTDKRQIDHLRLREAFYKAYDFGRLSDVASRLAAGRSVQGMELIGAGMHFRCWREQSGGKGPGLVVKLASEQLLTELGNPEIWISSLKRLGSGNCLIPPFEIIGTGAGHKEPLAMVMPFGPDAADYCSPWWLPLEDRIRDFYESMKRVGFALGDVPQIRSWDGIPFLVDLSDLRTLRAEGSLL